MTDLSPRTLRTLVWVTSGVLLLVIGSILVRASPSSEAVRLRNALLLQEQSDVALDWTPREVPASFLVEKLQVPVRITVAAKTIASTIGSKDDLTLARALAAHLNSHALKGGRIRSLDVAEIYRTIIEDGNGYCADIVDAYVALAHAAGLFVRPWAFSFDGYGGLGHINVEVFDRSRNAWVLLDVFNNVMPTERESGRPLSVIEFRAAFEKDPESVKFVPIAEGRQRIPIYSKLVDYYARGHDQWYLWSGNNVMSRTDSPLIKAAERIGEPLAEAVSIWQGRYPRIHPIASTTNHALLESMHDLRVKLLVSLYAAIGLGALLLLEFGLLIRRMRNDRL